MRPKKDPGIRREVFVAAASELFLKYGYDAVSVKSVLDAVGERSASPSVFIITLQIRTSCIGLPWKMSRTLMLRGLKKRFLLCSGLFGERDLRFPALFISGGISSMLMDHMMQPDRSEEKERLLIKEIVMFSASVLNLDGIDAQMLSEKKEL